MINHFQIKSLLSHFGTVYVDSNLKRSPSHFTCAFKMVSNFAL